MPRIPTTPPPRLGVIMPSSSKSRLQDRDRSSWRVISIQSIHDDWPEGVIGYISVS
jgi:hypothetical protein